MSQSSVAVGSLYEIDHVLLNNLWKECIIIEGENILHRQIEQKEPDSNE